MSKRVFAYELEPGDRISHLGEEVVIETAESKPKDGGVYTYVVGYYEESGDDFHRFYDDNGYVVVL